MSQHLSLLIVEVDESGLRGSSFSKLSFGYWRSEADGILAYFKRHGQPTTGVFDSLDFRSVEPKTHGYEEVEIYLLDRENFMAMEAQIDIADYEGYRYHAAFKYAECIPNTVRIGLLWD